MRQRKTSTSFKVIFSNGIQASFGKQIFHVQKLFFPQKLMFFSQFFPENWMFLQFLEWKKFWFVTLFSSSAKSVNFAEKI